MPFFVALALAGALLGCSSHIASAIVAERFDKSVKAKKADSYQEAKYLELITPGVNDAFDQKGVTIALKVFSLEPMTEAYAVAGVDIKDKIFLNTQPTSYEGTTFTKVPALIVSLPKSEFEAISKIQPGSVATFSGTFVKMKSQMLGTGYLQGDSFTVK